MNGMPQARTQDDLDAIAVELYALPPAQFTAARNARAGASDRSLGALIKRLPKPGVAAWAVSLLAREGQLGDALELAAALREAQDDLDAAELSASARSGARSWRRSRSRPSRFPASVASR